MKRSFWIKALVCTGIALTTGLWAGPPTCPVTTGSELIANGDFSGGNTVFTSEYTYATGSVGPGNYTVGTNPNTVNSYFATIGDHTTGTGNMLITDVDGTLGKDVYSNTVTVTAGRTYFFSAWFADINTNTSCAKCSVSPPKYENAPKLKFSINGVQVGGNVDVDSMSHNWEQFNAQWTATTSGTITIKIENLITTSNGNDLALDDVSFKAGCDGIKDLSALGKTSGMVDTVYTCNENFAYALDTKLTNSKYAFNWYQASAVQQTGILLDDQKTGTSSSTYSIGAAPANKTKYYVCYDSLGDKLSCPRLDSVLFLSQFNFDIPDQKVCPPVSVVLDPSLTTTNITSWKYERILPAPVTTINSGTGFVSPQTVNKAGTYRLTIVHGNGSCSASPDLIKIDTMVAAFNGAITASCSGGVATGTANLAPNITGTTSVTMIGGLANVSWYTAASAGTLVSGPIKTADGASTTAATNLIKTNTACPQGGLYLQDNNSFATTLGGTTQCTSSTSSVQFSSMKYMKIKLTAPTTITSIGASVKTYNASDALALSIQVFKNNPIGQYYSSCNCQSDGPLAAVYKSGVVNTISPGTTPKNAQILAGGSGIALDTGTYWINISNTGQGGEVTNSTCAKTYPYSDASSVITVGGLLDKGGNTLVAQSGEMYNLQFQVGNPTSCGRVWVCASCTLPVDYTYFNVYATGGQEVLITWGVAQQSKNKVFLVEASADGVNFRTVATINGAGDTHLQMDYSVQDEIVGTKQYYRIKQVDHDGQFSYTPVRAVSLNGSDVIGEIYPQPVPHGDVLQIKTNGLSETILHIKLQSLSGADVTEQQVIIGENTEVISLSTSGLTAGLYLLTISNADFVKTLKIVIE